MQDGETRRGVMAWSFPNFFWLTKIVLYFHIFIFLVISATFLKGWFDNQAMFIREGSQKRKGEKKYYLFRWRILLQAGNLLHRQADHPPHLSSLWLIFESHFDQPILLARLLAWSFMHAHHGHCQALIFRHRRGGSHPLIKQRHVCKSF